MPWDEFIMSFKPKPTLVWKFFRKDDVVRHGSRVADRELGLQRQHTLGQGGDQTAVYDAFLSSPLLSQADPDLAR